MTDWSRIAREAVAKVASTIPETATLRERRMILRAADPFTFTPGGWQKKCWGAARRAYLAKFTEDGRPILAGADSAKGLEHLPRDPVTGRPVI